MAYPYAIYSIPENGIQKQLLPYVFKDVAIARQTAVENGLDNFQIMKLLKDGICEIRRSGI